MSLVLEFSDYTYYYVVCLCWGTVRMANAIDARQNWGSILEPGTGQDNNSWCEFIVELFLCMNFISIQETNLDIFILFHKFFHGFSL